MEKDTRFRDECNFRDLGGYETISGLTVKPHLIYRSAGLYRFNEEEREIFRSMNFKAVLDLRAEHEQLKKPDPEFEGVKRLEHSMTVSRYGEEIDFSHKGMYVTGTAAKEQLSKLKKYYDEMPFGNETFHLLMNTLLKGEDVPIVFHCATGKDRTGVAAMIILMGLGCDEETILNDYLLSNVYYQKTIESNLRAHNERCQSDAGFKELLIMTNGVSETVGRSIIESVKQRYDSFDDYIKDEFDWNEADLERFRGLYLEKHAINQL